MAIVRTFTGTESRYYPTLGRQVDPGEEVEFADDAAVPDDGQWSTGEAAPQDAGPSAAPVSQDPQTAPSPAEAEPAPSQATPVEPASQPAPTKGA